MSFNSQSRMARFIFASPVSRVPKRSSDTFQRCPHQDFAINITQSHSSRGRYTASMNIYNRSIHCLLSKKLLIPFDNSIIHN